MKITKEQLFGFAFSSILCLIIAFILSVIFLQTKMRTEEEGVLVSVGNVNWANGTFTPQAKESTPEVVPEKTTPEVKPNKPAAPPVITQKDEPSVAVKTSEKKSDKERIAEEQKKASERKRVEEQRQREAINRQMEGAFGTKDGQGSSRGTAASGSGTQGSPQGRAPVGSYVGFGDSFDLAGRSLGEGGLQRPAYIVQEEGTIVTEITVDPQGNVIKAEIRLTGTNTDNASMRKSVIEAAKKTKFNAINGTQNQIGTITYRFSLK
ncbi:MAG: TonB family protein [Candidatus Azobacteroides sp.]|nr:TonB family protein [Candidatus Azobacteroides sp.]